VVSIQIDATSLSVRQEAGWASEAVWTFRRANISWPSGIRSLESPARSPVSIMPATSRFPVCTVPFYILSKCKWGM